MRIAKAFGRFAGLVGKKEKNPSIPAEILRVSGKKGGAPVPLFVINAFSMADFHQQMKKAGINIEKTVLFEKNDVYVFMKEQLQAFLGKAQMFVCKKVASMTKNVEWVWVKDAPVLPRGINDYIAAPACDVIEPAVVKHFCGDTKEAFAYIATAILGKLIGRQIVLEVAHGNAVAYDPVGPFCIHLGSTPDENRSVYRDSPKYIWGIKVETTGSSFSPNGTPLKVGGVEHNSLVVFDGDFAVAELFPNALYLHQDIRGHGSDNETLLFAAILSKCAPFLVSPEEFARYQEDLEKQRIEAGKKAFMDLVEKSVSKRATRQETAIEAAEKIAAQKRREYFEAERVLFAERQVLLDPDVMKKRFVDEYEKLRLGEVDLIKSINFDPFDTQWIVVHTEEITIVHPTTKNVHVIGKCDISFDLDSGAIKIVNLDRELTLGRRTFYTPHVFNEPGFNVCLGNIKEELLSYLAHYEIEAAAVLAIAFLQSVKNQDDYLGRLEKFPIAKEEKVTA